MGCEKLPAATNHCRSCSRITAQDFSTIMPAEKLMRFATTRTALFASMTMAAMMAVITTAAMAQSTGAATGDRGSSTQKGQAKENSYDWPVYGGTSQNDHFSPLKQINRSNVQQLEVAWSFDTGETGGLQTSPIVVQGVLYGITPSQKVFAVDAATGKLLWKFDSGIKGTQPDRGLAYWSDGKASRILVAVMNFVYALDATTGTPISTLRQGWAASICARTWGAIRQPSRSM